MIRWLSKKSGAMMLLWYSRSGSSDSVVGDGDELFINNYIQIS